jgi:hypothetical protein
MAALLGTDELKAESAQEHNPLCYCALVLTATARRPRQSNSATARVQPPEPPLSL